MPTYAVPVGTLVLQSEKPITQEQQKQAVEEFKRTFRGAMMHTREGLLVKMQDG